MGWILFKLFVPFMELIKREQQIRAHMLMLSTTLCGCWHWRWDELLNRLTKLIKAYTAPQNMGNIFCFILWAVWIMNSWNYSAELVANKWVYNSSCSFLNIIDNILSYETGNKLCNLLFHIAYLWNLAAETSKSSVTIFSLHENISVSLSEWRLSSMLTYANNININGDLCQILTVSDKSSRWSSSESHDTAVQIVDWKFTMPYLQQYFGMNAYVIERLAWCAEHLCSL